MTFAFVQGPCGFHSSLIAVRQSFSFDISLSSSQPPTKANKNFAAALAAIFPRKCQDCFFPSSSGEAQANFAYAFFFALARSLDGHISFGCVCAWQTECQTKARIYSRRCKSSRISQWPPSVPSLGYQMKLNKTYTIFTAGERWFISSVSRPKCWHKAYYTACDLQPHTSYLHVPLSLTGSASFTCWYFIYYY